MPIPSPVLCVVNLCAGFGGACSLGELARCGKPHQVQSYARFTSLSLVGGGILFVLAALVPRPCSPCSASSTLLSVGLLRFAGERGGNLDAPSRRLLQRHLEIRLEIEPSLVAFGIVFGSRSCTCSTPDRRTCSWACCS